jgi:ribosome-associated translation inhibitor RaiA
MLPLRLAVHHTDLPPDVRADIQRRVVRLQRWYPRIISCRVTIEVPQRRRRTDRELYRARLALSVPQGIITIDRQPRQTLDTALDDVFGAARRRLLDYARRWRVHRVPAEEATV